MLVLIPALTLSVRYELVSSSIHHTADMHVVQVCIRVSRYCALAWQRHHHARVVAPGDWRSTFRLSLPAINSSTCIGYKTAVCMYEYLICFVIPPRVKIQLRRIFARQVRAGTIPPTTTVSTIHYGISSQSIRRCTVCGWWSSDNTSDR